MARIPLPRHHRTRLLLYLMLGLLVGLLTFRWLLLSPFSLYNWLLAGLIRLLPIPLGSLLAGFLFETLLPVMLIALVIDGIAMALEDRKRLVATALAACLAGQFLLIGSYELARSAAPSTARARTGYPGAIVIQNSGSTNAPAYTVTVNPDGSGSDTRHDRQYAADTLDYRSLQATLQAVPNWRFRSHCVKSASFGTTVTITYNGRTSGDISCPPNPAITQLYQLVTNLTTTY